MDNTNNMPVGCVVLAAGNAERFGKNKLLALYRGRTLIERALDAVPAGELSAVCVVTQYDEVDALARRYGFLCVRNDRPDLGVSRSLRLGLEALAPTCRGVLFQVADQPLLTRESVSALVRRFREEPARIVCLSHAGKRGNPCLFPAALYPELMALSGDTGGRAVIARHEELVTLVDADGSELADMDTPEALEAL